MTPTEPASATERRPGARSAVRRRSCSTAPRPGTCFTISAFSRPAAWNARLGAPDTLLVQRRILSVYMTALKA